MSYIICFWDKSKIQVDEVAGTKLKEAKASGYVGTFEIENGLYSMGGVEKIIPKSEAYDIFPTEFEQLKNMEDKKSNLPLLEGAK